ncbi:helix-turn-helix transcriptional regulator [Rhodovarius crocodyli]
MLRDTFRFSRRETDVALGILMGLRPTDIAQTLSISVETVRSHLKSAMAKAGCTQQAQLALLLARLPSET